MQRNNHIGGDQVPPGGSSPKLENFSKISQNSLSPKSQRKTNKHPGSLNVKKSHENHAKDPSDPSPTTPLKKISLQRIVQANEKPKPSLEEPKTSRRKLLLPKFKEKIKLSIETNSPTQASPKLHSIKFPNTARPTLGSREAFPRSPGIPKNSNTTEDPKYFVSPRLSLAKIEVKSESPRKSSIQLPKIPVLDANNTTEPSNNQQKLHPTFNFMKMTASSIQNRRNSQVVEAKPTMHFGSMRSQRPSFLIPGSGNLHKESPEAVTKSRRGSVNIHHSKESDEIHQESTDGKMLHPLRKSSNFSIKKDEEFPKTDSPTFNVNVSLISSQTEESSDHENESVDLQECETPTKLPIKIPFSFNSAKKSRFALIATKSVPNFTLVALKSSSENKLFNLDEKNQETQENDSESSPRNHLQPRETLADLEASSISFQADEGQKNPIHLENLNEDYGLPAASLMSSLTSRAASNMPIEVPEKVVKSQSLSPRKHNNKAAASEIYQFDDIERRKSSEAEKEKYKIFKDNNVNFFEFNENNLLFNRESNIFTMDKIFRSTIKSKTYAEMQADSSARVVSYGDEHRTITIHPKYMELYGSMCFTELWTGKKKRDFQHQKSEESDPIRKKGNADPILRPKRSKERNIVLARLEANKQGNQSSANRIHEFFGLSTKADGKKFRPTETQAKVYPKLRGVYNLEDSPVHKPVQISLNRRISRYHTEH